MHTELNRLNDLLKGYESDLKTLGDDLNETTDNID